MGIKAQKIANKSPKVGAVSANTFGNEKLNLKTEISSDDSPLEISSSMKSEEEDEILHLEILLS